MSDRWTREISNYTLCDSLLAADHPNSCRFFNSSSPIASSYVRQCNDDDDDTNDINGEYECRLLIVSYRSIDTYLRRDCAPKGLCAWKDRTQSMIDTPVSDCVFTDDHSQRLECIYCCDTPLCNRTVIGSGTPVRLLVGLVLIYLWYQREDNWYRVYSPPAESWIGLVESTLLFTCSDEWGTWTRVDSMIECSACDTSLRRRTVRV